MVENIVQKTKSLRNAYEVILKAKYMADIKKLKENQSNNIIIDCEDFKNQKWNDVDLLDKLITDYEDINSHIKAIIRNILNNEVDEFYVRYRNLKTIPIENLMTKQLTELTETKGTVTAIYPIKARVTNAVFECMGCMRLVEGGVGKKIVPPSICGECGGRSFRFDAKNSTFENVREFILTQSIETIKNKSQPRKLKCIIAGDEKYINNIFVGSKVTLTGVLKAYGDGDSSYLDYEYEVNHLQNDEEQTIQLTPTEREEFQRMGKEKDILNKLIKSFAPDLILPDNLKLGILCYLVKSSKLENTHDMIHILVISDPATAKSKLKQRTYELAEKCVLTSGTGASGVGISGAIDKDPITKHNILRAGAIPLAHNGHCIIDEIDKMSPEDCTRANNYMESGYDNYNKGGVNETLIGETSILALGNPKYGRYDPYKSLGEQVRIETTFLSRFDLKFLLEDLPNEEKDSQIIDSILDPYTTKDNKGNENNEDTLSTEYLKKYLSYARNYFNPRLNKHAKELIKQHSLQYRKTDTSNSIITYDMRAVRSIPKLAGAIAKLRLGTQITKYDVKRAIELQEYCLKAFGIDPVTNEYDMSRYNGTPNNADKNNRQIILSIMKNYLNENDTNFISKTELLEIFQNQTNLNKSTFYENTKTMKNNGDIKATKKGKIKGYTLKK